MECFVIGDNFDLKHVNNISNSTVGTGVLEQVTVDGSGNVSGYDSAITEPVATYALVLNTSKNFKTAMGLHKIDARWWCTSGTVLGNYRVLNVRNAK
jgi:hypothetical protein